MCPRACGTGSLELPAILTPFALSAWQSLYSTGRQPESGPHVCAQVWLSRPGSPGADGWHLLTMQRKGVAGGGGGPSPAQVAVYEHSFDVTWPGVAAEPGVIVSVNVFRQPYTYVYVTTTPPPAVWTPAMPHSPWLHGPMEPTSMQSAGLSFLYFTTDGCSAYCWQPDGSADFGISSHMLSE